MNCSSGYGDIRVTEVAIYYGQIGLAYLAGVCLFTLENTCALVAGFTAPERLCETEVTVFCLSYMRDIKSFYEISANWLAAVDCTRHVNSDSASPFRMNSTFLP